MFHRSELGEHAEGFPHDEQGYVPVEGDSWRQMQFQHRHDDPDEPGITEDERARRLRYLDEEWWPQVLAKVSDERHRLAELHGETFTSHWDRVIRQSPPETRGFEPT